MEEAKKKDMSSLDALAELKEKVCCTRFLFLFLHLTVFPPKPTDDWSVPPKTVNVIPLLDPGLRVLRSGCQLNQLKPVL